MRIITGEARGKRIPSPKVGRIRPTPQQVKESLFNILPEIKGRKFLDLYAGTGAIGIEALSRGAAKVVFVEKNHRLSDHLRFLIRQLGFENRGKVIGGDVVKVVTAMVGVEMPFDIIFADPPYDLGFVDSVCRVCLSAGLLDEKGMMVVQHSSRERIDPTAAPYAHTETWERKYGQTVLTFLRFVDKEQS